MLLCRYDDRVGLIRDGKVLDVTPALDELPSHRYPLPPVDPLIAHLPQLRAGIEAQANKAKPVPVETVKLLSPIANPGKVVAAPVNYRKHLEEGRADPGINFNRQVQEIRQAGVFLKATSSVVGPSQGVAVRHPDRRTDHEIELAAIIGKRADRVSRERALSHVAGYCIGLDITVRGPEERSLRKSIDGYTVLGPWLVTADAIPDPGALGFTLKVNGEVRQQSNTADLILDIAELIAFASSYYTLMPGDVLLTGTPEGVGPIHAGDVMTASIEHIGSMDVHVRAADAPRAE